MRWRRPGSGCGSCPSSMPRCGAGIECSCRPVSTKRRTAPCTVAGAAGLGDSQVDALIEKQIAFFERLSLAFEWKTYAHDGRADLPRRLISHGLIPEEPESLVIGRISELNQEPDLPERVALREVHSSADT